jgi:hypothetical protein
VLEWLGSAAGALNVTFMPRAARAETRRRRAAK